MQARQGGVIMREVYFCGVCCTGDGGNLPRELKAALERLNLSFEQMDSGPLTLWCGASRPRAFARIESPRGLAALAGELIWEGGPPEEDQPAVLERLLDCLCRNRPEGLSQANGTFAALAWDSAERRLWLAADSLGGRPLYFARCGSALVFSTMLEILLYLPSLPRTFDFAAFVEQEAFCYPLADRTLYEEIRVLRDSEYLLWTPSEIRRDRYFDWSRIELFSLSLEDVADGCVQAVSAAVRDRAPGAGGTAKALLSGGLDSRWIVALLHEMDIPLRVSTLRIPESEDYEYSRRFALLLGLTLEEAEYTVEAAPRTIGTTTAHVLAAAAAPLTPGRVFSGDGGGETVGFLLMPPGVMERFGRGEIEPAIGEYLQGHEMPGRLFRPQWRSLAAEHAPRAMREALSQYAHAPAQKAMHLFVILNDLRRHLHDFFEIAPGIGLDLALPFYDRRVLHSVLRLAPPLDPYLSHRLYHAVLQRVPQDCVRVPWQSYPGRLPCPLPREGPPLKTQWQLNQEWRSRKTAVFCRHVLSEWRRGRLAADYLNVPLLAAAAGAHRLGLRDFGYWLRPALALSDAVRRSRIGSRDCA